MDSGKIAALAVELRAKGNVGFCALLTRFNFLSSPRISISVPHDVSRSGNYNGLSACTTKWVQETRFAWLTRSAGTQELPLPPQVVAQQLPQVVGQVVVEKHSPGSFQQGLLNYTISLIRWWMRGEGDNANKPGYRIWVIPWARPPLGSPGTP